MEIALIKLIRFRQPLPDNMVSAEAMDEIDAQLTQIEILKLEQLKFEQELEAAEKINSMLSHYANNPHLLHGQTLSVTINSLELFNVLFRSFNMPQTEALVELIHFPVIMDIIYE